MPRLNWSSLGLALLAVAVLMSLPSPSGALEKRLGRAVDDDRAWSAGGSFSISYYNFCNGWVWIWEDWGPNDVFGVAYDFSHWIELRSTWWFFGAGVPAGYGFTGTIDVNFVDGNDCAAHGPIASQTFLPTTGWNIISWGSGVYVGSSPFSITMKFGPGTEINEAAVWTDHPAAGPTGPQACGTCYPNPRENHSFYYGTASSPLCPGSPLNDGTCDSEFLQSSSLSGAISVEEHSWSSLKSLYR